jgi:hypothetical protein
MTNAHLKCSFTNANSSAVPNTLIDLFLQFNTVTVDDRQNCTSWRPFRPLLSANHMSSYRHAELPIFRTFHKFSHLWFLFLPWILVTNLRILQWRRRRGLSGIWRHLIQQKFADVPKEYSASIFRIFITDLIPGYVLGFLHDPEDGRSMFLRNSGEIPNSTASRSRQQYFSR